MISGSTTAFRLNCNEDRYDGWMLGISCSSLKIRQRLGKLKAKGECN